MVAGQGRRHSRTAGTPHSAGQGDVNGAGHECSPGAMKKTLSDINTGFNFCPD